MSPTSRSTPASQQRRSNTAHSDDVPEDHRRGPRRGPRHHRQGRRRRRHRLRLQRRHARLRERRRRLAHHRQHARQPDTTRPGDASATARSPGIIAGNSLDRTTTDPLRGAHRDRARGRPDRDHDPDDAGNSTMLDVSSRSVRRRPQEGPQHPASNLSVGSDTPGSYLDDPLDAAVESPGTPASWRRPPRQRATPATPSSTPRQRPVHHLRRRDRRGRQADPADDTLAAFSSRDIARDSFAKPDILAPGAHIPAPLAAGSAFATLCPQCVVDGEYLGIGGRRWPRPSSPRRGAAAPGPPNLDPDQVKGLLTPTSPNATASGAAELDVAAALRGRGTRREPGPEPNPPVAAGPRGGGHQPDPRHLDEGGLDQGDVVQGRWTKAT